MACPVCQSEQHRKIFQLDSDEVHSCDQCSMVFAVAPAFDKMALYSQAYFSGEVATHGYQNYESEFISHHATFLDRLRASEARLGQKGVLLDYGCAVGHLAKTAQTEGWQVFATDLSLYAVQSAREKFGIHGFVSDLTHPPIRPAIFDLITLYDVIEHVPQPAAILRQLQALLKKQGLLHITTPNVKSWSARLMGPSWYHYKAQEHLLYFSPQTLNQTLEQCGFEALEFKSAPSSMTLQDIFVRLRRYSAPLANLSLKIFRALGLEKRVLRLKTGEMQTWARAKTPRLAYQNTRRSAQFEKALVQMPVLEVVCCPDCHGGLEPDEKLTQLTCLNCAAAFEVRNQVPILLPSANKRKKAI